jgi:hypothetical protein
MLQNWIIRLQEVFRQWRDAWYPPSARSKDRPRLDYPEWRLLTFVRHCSVSMRYYDLFRRLD